ncbi:MAG: fused MFS/spermidine synthase [Deltaproteobacteria bacterium]|nr:fused MFS/spermidine synthase [Deltaproteobacteria bacterium]
MRKEVVKAVSVVFIASFCTMVIELVAGRILAPYVGVSLYTWTSIIGVVLAGISVGAYLGGILADRFPRPRTLGWLLFLSGLAALSISPLTASVARWSLQTSLMLRILFVTAVIFFLPSCLLGMISPVVVRLALDRLERAGNVVGRIYAFSTLGSILGTFATGFALISWMGTRNILLLMGVILVVSAPLFGGAFLRRRVFLILFPALLGVLWAVHGQAFKKPRDENSYFYEETDYFSIELKKIERKGQRLEAVILDNLIHSYVDLADPLHLEYDYERVYAEMVAWKAPPEAEFRALIIGGGGYTFPRYLEARYPRARIDVIEIDPRLTEIAHRHLGLSPQTRIRSFNQDARWFVMNSPERKVYDFIFTDAFNDLTIPYHLTTREFSQMLGALLKPGGMLMANIIDDFPAGLFMPSYVRTLQEVFGPRRVCLVADSDFSEMGTSTMIVAASQADHPWEDLPDESGGQCFVLAPPELNEKLKNRPAVLLTDDHAPVDNLVAPMFEARFGRKRSH